MISSRKLIPLIVLGMSLLLGCGGGADVGNPSFTIEGCVKTPTDENASNATVILGRNSAIPFSGEAKDTVTDNGITIIYTRHFFDTTTCDAAGRFVFENVSQGEYMIFAEQQKKNGITKVSITYENEYATIGLDDPVDITIKPYAVLDTIKPYFIGSRIAGAPLFAKADSAGVILFKSVPSGLLDVVLYKSDTSMPTFKNLIVSPVSGAILMVDPTRTPYYWTARSDKHDPIGRPYVFEYGIWNNSLPRAGDTEYDFYIQFSHYMNTILTSKALHISSSDSTIRIDEIFWQGADLVYLRFCVKDSAGICNRDRLSNISSWTVGVDTLARTNLGYEMAWPEVFEVKR